MMYNTKYLILYSLIVSLRSMTLNCPMDSIFNLDIYIALYINISIYRVIQMKGHSRNLDVHKVIVASSYVCDTMFRHWSNGLFHISFLGHVILPPITHHQVPGMKFHLNHPVGIDYFCFQYLHNKSDILIMSVYFL